MKTLETKKLFYRRYPYKVACLIDGAYHVSRYGTNYAVSKALEWDRKYGSQAGWVGFSYKGKPKLDVTELENFCLAVRPFLEDENIRVRAEGKHFNLFCLDQATYDEIHKSLKEWAYELTAPKSDKDLKYLLANKAIKVLVDKLPYEKYKYKIVLKPNLKADQRAKLAGWVSKYSEEELLPSPSTKRWFSDKVKYVQDPFIYVAEDGMRTLVELYLGPNKSRTEEFVLRSSLEEA